MEENLRRALVLSRGDPMVFISSPMSAVLLLISVVMLGLALLPSVRRERDEVFADAD